jgi:hypothetical protein
VAFDQCERWLGGHGPQRPRAVLAALADATAAAVNLSNSKKATERTISTGSMRRPIGWIYIHPSMKLTR